MKTNFSTGRILKLAAIPAICIASLIYSCKKDATSSSTNSTVTAADAGQVMVDAVSPTTGGVVLQTNYSVSVAVTNVNPVDCGVKKDTTITSSQSNNGNSYNYSLNWGRMLSCNGSIPSAFDFTFSGTSSYSIPQMSSDDNSQGTFSMTGLQPTSSQITINETYARNGSQQSKVNQQRSFTSKTTVSVTNLVINKSTQAIVSGSGTITVTGNSSTGGSFSYNGTITFNGNNKATIAVSGGSTYTVQW